MSAVEHFLIAADRSQSTRRRQLKGFSFVLAGAKALLEHNVLLNLVRDRFPDGVPRE